MQSTLHHPLSVSSSHTGTTYGTPCAPERLPAVNSQALLQGQKAITIHHNGALYRLQNTRQGKLILTK